MADDKEPWNGVTDYCLYHLSGEILAIVEAKRTRLEVRKRVVSKLRTPKVSKTTPNPLIPTYRCRRRSPRAVQG